MEGGGGQFPEDGTPWQSGPVRGGSKCSFTPPRTFRACKAVTLGDARDGTLSNPKKIITKLHVNWGRSSAQQIKRILVDSEGKNLHLLWRVDEASERRDVCRASRRAPHVPIAGTSTVSTFKNKMQVDLLFLGDIIVLRVMDVFSKYSPLTPARYENPQEVRGALTNLWIGISGPPK